MIWWSWNTTQRLSLIGVLVGISALATAWLVWLGMPAKASLGACAFLLIPQLLVCMVFVGLKTGVMPARRGRVSHADAPVVFWILALTYAALAAAFLGFLLYVASGA